MRKIGIGITTYNRPDYLKQCLEHISKNIKSVDFLVVYNDASDIKHHDMYKVALSKIESHPVHPDKFIYIVSAQNRGVAHAKNRLLEELIDKGCTDLFLLEDDILLLDDKAVTEYIRICEEYGFEHAMFAHHGDANKSALIYGDNDVEYYNACVGAWCYYTRNAIEKLRELEEKQGLAYPGFFDENFKNAWEHVEHTKRLGDAGFTGWWGMFVDIKNSKQYISEIEGSIDNSSIRPNTGWKQNQIDGLAYWEKKWGVKPDIQLGSDQA